MHATKIATRRSSASPRPTDASSIPYEAVSAWLEWRYREKPQGKSKLDPRLLALDPIVTRILAGITQHERGNPMLKPAVMAFARAALHTPADAGVTENWHHAKRLAAVVCDWMVRCAVPRWFDRLPDWCAPHASADRLAELQSLQWIDTVVRAISVLTPMWIYLEHAHRDRGTAAERAVIIEAHEKAGDALGILAHLLTLQWRYKHTDPAFLCQMAMSVIHNHQYAPDAELVDALPALASVLFAITPGDSQRSVAERCTWPGPFEAPKAARPKSA